MKKNIQLSLASLLAAGIVLSGCGSGAGSATEQLNKENSSTASSEKKEIKFLMRGNANEPINKMFVEDIKAFEQKNPNITVKYEFVAVADVETKLNSAFAGGTAPDLFDIGIAMLASRAQLKQFTPLDG
jgi:ABC-type glycerol-3-phosphate transport system substrate-binding protein